MINSMALTKERKIILIGGAVLLLLGAIYRFYPDLISIVSVSDEIEMKKKHIEKYMQISDLRESALVENKAFKRRYALMKKRLLTGDTSTLAAVEIQEILKEIGDASGVKIMSMRVMKPEDGGHKDYIRLPVQFSMNSDIIQLKDIIYQIEASDKLLVITGLDAKRARSKENQLIRSVITVEGCMKADLAEG